MYIDGVDVCANLGVEVSKKMCHQSTAKTLAQKNQKKKEEEEEEEEEEGLCPSFGLIRL